MKKMKLKLMIFTLVMIIGLSTSVFAYGSMFGVGLVGFTPFTSDENDAAFMDTAFWGVSFRFKGDGLLGFIIDVMYFNTTYWIQDTDWYGPMSWDSMTTDFYSVWNTGGAIPEDQWEYYQDEFFGHFDLALFIPLGPVMFHFATGPSVWWASPSDAYDWDTEFAAAWDDYYTNNGGAFTLGYNIKLGVDILLGTIGIGVEYNYMVEKIGDFFDYAFGTDDNPNDEIYYGWEYLKRNGYFELSVMFWFY